MSDIVILLFSIAVIILLVLVFSLSRLIAKTQDMQRQLNAFKWCRDQEKRNG